MKVAMVTPYWFPVRGGITTYVAGLAEEVRRRGHEVMVIARQGEGPGATVVNAAGLAFAKGASAVLRRFHPDVVHAHGHWYTLAAAIRYRGARPETRIVFTLHTAFPRMAWWRRMSLSTLMSQADFVTAVSGELLGRTLRAIPSRARVRVTPPGVPLRVLDPDSAKDIRKAFGLEARSPVIGYLGRLSWEFKVRGVEQLIRAMPLVRRSFPAATLAVGGDGHHRQRLEALAEKVAPGAVVFLGDVPDPSPRFFLATDLYAHISYQEGLPIALLEAMACESPIVASATGGIPELIQDGVNGFLVANDPTLIARRIVELLQDPELRRHFVMRAWREVATKYSWPRAADRFLPLFGARSRQRVVMTVDLERDYHTRQPSFQGIEVALPRLLELFERNGVHATMFATADLTERHADRLRDVVRAGHELGCHGPSHDVEYISRQPLEWQLSAIREATERLAQVTGTRPRGFRAPNFSADGNTVRALEELRYRYDSSVLPGRTVGRVFRKLDFRTAPRDPYRPDRHDPGIPGDSRLWEVPVAENPFAPGGPIGLGYVNAYGAERALEAVAHSSSDPCVFLVHPWELLDPPEGPVPEWMRGACTSDLTRFNEFLTRLRDEHEMTTIASVLA